MKALKIAKSFDYREIVFGFGTSESILEIIRG